MEAGFARPDVLDGDTDFDAIRDDPRYVALHRRLQRARFPCRFDEAYGALDFWVGTWDVFNPAGQKVAATCSRRTTATAPRSSAGRTPGLPPDDHAGRRRRSAAGDRDPGGRRGHVDHGVRRAVRAGRGRRALNEASALAEAPTGIRPVAQRWLASQSRGLTAESRDTYHERVSPTGFRLICS